MSISHPSSDHCRTIIDSLGDGLWIADGAHRLAYANRGLADLVGGTVGQLLGTHVLDGLPEGFTRFFRSEYQAALAGGQPRAYACRAIVAGGRETWLRGWLSPQQEGGMFAGMVGSMCEDSGRQWLDQTFAAIARCAGLAPGQPRLRALIRHLAGCLDHSYVDLSRCDVGGGNAQALARWCAGRFVEPAEAANDSPFTDSRCRQNLGLLSYLESPLCRHDGKSFGRIVLLGERPPADRAVAEQILKLVAGRIATELERLDAEATRQAVLAQQASAPYQRALLDNFPFMVWLKDEQSRFLAVNQALADFFGVPPEKLIGCCDEAIAPAELAESYRFDDRAVMAAGLSQQLEEQVERHGERRWFEVYKSPLAVEERVVGTVGFARDITERKRAEAELLAAKSDAERANRAKSRFLAAASHDLRQPLSALALYIGVLQQRVGADSQELVANIRNCLDSLSDLLAKLLDVSKLDAGVVVPKRLDFAVDDLLSALVSVHAAEAELQGLHLRWRKSGAVVYTDQVLLRRIVGNFLANAIRYTERGGVLVACRRRRGKLWIEVRDTGIGIAEDKTEAIFEEFCQLGDESRRRGSGLGLAIVAKTARLLNLEVRVRSRSGRGSLFAIEVPPGRAAMVTSRAPAMAAARSVRIGLVEDNTELRQALACALSDAGHEVVVAASGAGLLGLLAGRGPDAVISDYRLGGQKNGFDAIAALRRQFGENLPALLITGDTNPALVRSMADRGIPVCYKPLQLGALLAFIAEVTERRGQ